MDLHDKLNQALGSGDLYAVAVAQQIANIHEAFESKSITADEAKDLLSDMNTATSLLSMAKDMKAKILLQEAISDLINIVELAAGI